MMFGVGGVLYLLLEQPVVHTASDAIQWLNLLAPELFF